MREISLPDGIGAFCSLADNPKTILGSIDLLQSHDLRELNFPTDTHNRKHGQGVHGQLALSA
jgi:hypothetical protein